MKPLALLAALTLLALSRAAAANPPEAATQEHHSTPLVPTKLSGSTDGKAKLDVGLGYSFALDGAELSLSLVGSIATKDGSATLFSASDTGGAVSQSVPWSVGASISVARLRTGWKPNIDLDKKKQFEECDLACSADASDAFCKTRVASLKNHLTKRKAWSGHHPETMAVELFCASQKEAVAAVEYPTAPEPPAQLLGPLEPQADMVLKQQRFLLEQQRVLLAQHRVLLEQQRRAVREKALDACLQECADDGAAADPFCAGEVAAARAQIWHDYSTHELCAEGVKKYNKAEEKAGRALFPAWYLNVGGSFGRQEYTYRKDDGTAAKNLLLHDDFVVPWSAGVTYIALPKSGRYDPTFELQGLVSSSYSAATDTVKSCKPAGNVPRTEPKAGSTVGDTDPGQICEEQTLGSPTQTTGATFVFHAGIVDGANGAWRAAIGPEITIPYSGGKVQTPNFALRMPIYVSFAAFEKLDYKGIIRLSPALVVANQADGTRETKVLMELALLGQRRIFSDRFDNL